MSRFFINKAEIENGRVCLVGEDAKHAQRVLRMAVGDDALLCDGAGLDYPARVAEISADRLTFEVFEPVPSLGEPKTEVTLFQGLPKAGKMEIIIQKCVELGISGITPVCFSRCVVRVGKAEFCGKLQRYRRIAEEAAKQSRRGKIPVVNELVDCAGVDLGGFDLVLLPYEEERQTTLKQALSGAAPQRVAVIIGPEGGFAPEEVAALRAKGAVSVTLGRRILRTETAGMAVLAMLLYELEG